MTNGHTDHTCSVVCKNSYPVVCGDTCPHVKPHEHTADCDKILCNFMGATTPWELCCIPVGEEPTTP